MVMNKSLRRSESKKRKNRHGENEYCMQTQVGVV